MNGGKHRAAQHGKSTKYVSTTEEEAPWSTLCKNLITAYKKDEKAVVLQLYEELKAMPDLYDIYQASIAQESSQSASNTAQAKEEGEGEEEDTKSSVLGLLEFCWGRALLIARQLSSGDPDHIASFVNDFEELFGRHSDYLRVLALDADSALEALCLHQTIESCLSSDAVSAALHRFTLCDSNETRALLDFIRSNGVPLTRDVSEQLEKQFVMRMKNEDAEEVFEEMRALGVGPLTTCTYNIIFRKNDPFKYKKLIDYYEDMLDRGIAPELSTFRILSIVTKDESIYKRHFYYLAWRTAEKQRRGDEDERLPGQLFYASRLEELLVADHGAPIEALKRILNRMNLEGTPLLNDSPVLSVMLEKGCRHGHIEDTHQVLRLAAERGCNVTSATVLRVLKSNNPDRQRQTDILLRAALKSDELRPLEWSELLRHFVSNNMRTRAIRTFSAFVSRCLRFENEPIPFCLASTVMKLGPFVWVVGIVALLLATTNESLGAGVQLRMRDSASGERDREIVNALEICRWSRDSALLLSELQEDNVHNNTTTSPTSTTNNNNNNSSGKSNSNGKNASGALHSNGNGSNGNHRNHDSISWMSAMQMALMEMNFEKETVEVYRKKLTEAINSARKKASALKDN
ncbi:hypothetical protein ERJ75_000463100 [Trypanosoma vivax]|nr:hypothetical protein ERJ75_000463100 [Trypanosoma vivax]